MGTAALSSAVIRQLASPRLKRSIACVSDGPAPRSRVPRLDVAQQPDDRPLAACAEPLDHGLLTAEVGVVDPGRTADAPVAEDTGPARVPRIDFVRERVSALACSSRCISWRLLLERFSARGLERAGIRRWTCEERLAGALGERENDGQAIGLEEQHDPGPTPDEGDQQGARKRDERHAGRCGRSARRRAAHRPDRRRDRRPSRIGRPRRRGRALRGDGREGALHPDCSDGALSSAPASAGPATGSRAAAGESVGVAFAGARPARRLL